MSEFSLCEKKWWYRKVAQVPVDVDCADKKALGFGKAVHLVMERSSWKAPQGADVWIPLIQGACEEQEVPYTSWHNVTACCFSLWDHHAASGLTIVGIEEELMTGDFVGYIDALAQDSRGRYWILDLKTSSLMQELTFARLAQDTQLNMYAHYRYILKDKYESIVENLAGCAYRVVQKPYERKGKNAPKDWTEGAQCEAQCTTVYIPFSALDTQATVEKFQKVADRMNACTEPLCNRQSCVSWNTPCDYWSRCHGGKLRTECLEGIIKHEGRTPFKPDDIDDGSFTL